MGFIGNRHTFAFLLESNSNEGVLATVARSFMLFINSNRRTVSVQSESFRNMKRLSAMRFSSAVLLRTGCARTRQGWMCDKDLERLLQYLPSPLPSFNAVDFTRTRVSSNGVRTLVRKMGVKLLSFTNMTDCINGQVTDSTLRALAGATKLQECAVCLHAIAHFQPNDFECSLSVFSRYRSLKKLSLHFLSSSVTFTLPGLQLLEELTLKNNDWPSSRCRVVTQDDMPRLRKVTFDGFTLMHYGRHHLGMPHGSCMKQFMEFIPSIEEMIVNNAVVMVFQDGRRNRDPFRVDRELPALESCIQTLFGCALDNEVSLKVDGGADLDSVGSIIAKRAEVEAAKQKRERFEEKVKRAMARQEQRSEQIRAAREKGRSEESLDHEEPRVASDSEGPEQSSSDTSEQAKEVKEIKVSDFFKPRTL